MIRPGASTTPQPPGSCCWPGTLRRSFPSVEFWPTPIHPDRFFSIRIFQLSLLKSSSPVLAEFIEQPSDITCAVFCYLISNPKRRRSCFSQSTLSALNCSRASKASHPYTMAGPPPISTATLIASMISSRVAPAPKASWT